MACTTPCLYGCVSADNGNEGGEGEEAECVPQDTIAAKYEAYSEPNSPSHEGAHSSQEENSHKLISYCESQARGETINKHTSLCGGNGRGTRRQTAIRVWGK